MHSFMGDEPDFGILKNLGLLRIKVLSRARGGLIRKKVKNCHVTIIQAPFYFWTVNVILN